MSFLLIDRPSTTTRASAATITSSVGGNFYNSGVGYAVLEASTATWVTNNVRKGDYVQVNGTREVSRWAMGAATTFTGGESIKIYSGDDARSYVLWFTKNGAGTAPTVTTEILLGPHDVTTGQSATTIGGQVRTFLNNRRNSSLYGKDFLASGGSGANVDLTCICPGNSTNSAIFTGAGFVTVSTTTAGVDLTSGNQGIYRVHEVISETMLLLNTNWIGGVGMAVDGTATVFISENILRIEDETTVDMDDIVTNCADDTIAERISFGSVHVDWPFKLYRLCLSNITFAFTGATTCDFNIYNSIACGAVGPTTAAGVHTSINVSGATGQLNINVGQAGASTNEFSNGSLISAINWSGSANTTISVAGSGIMNMENSTWTGVANKYSGMVLFGQIPTFDASSGNIETFNNIIIQGKGTNGLGIFANIDNSENILIAGSPASGFLVSTGDFTISDLEISPSAFTSIFNMAIATSNPTVLDPHTPYTLAQLFTGSGGTGSLSYTFNPTLVFRDEITKTPVPIAGLTVSIIEIRISDNNQTDLGDFVTDVNGELNSGAGVQLVRGTRAAGVEETYKYDILVQGPSIRAKRYYYIPRSKFEDDIVFDLIQFDLEGELGI